MLKKLILVLMLCLLVTTLGAAVVAQDSELSGELNVYPQNYYNPESDPETAAVMESVAQAYMEMHPNVTINLVPNLPAGTDYNTWLASRVAAGEAPDIAWDQYGNRNRVQGDWWVAMDDYLQQPNHYIEEGTPGSERWVESFPDYVINQTRAPDGHWYQVSLDWVETALYYNVDMFNEVGVEPNWDTWSEFVADMNKIRDTLGVDPVGLYQAGTGWSTWVWADDVFLSAVWHDAAPELFTEEYNALQPGRDFRMLNTEEVAKAIYDGKLDATDPRMDTYLEISKQFTDLLPVDYIGITSLDDIQRLFLSKEVASFWGGTWNNKQVDESADFEWGVAYLPPFTEEDFPGAAGVSYRVGGPSSAGQYGIPVATAEAGKLDLAVDFLMWMSAPQNFGPLASTYRGFIPMVAGTEGGDVVTNFSAVAALPERLFGDPSGRLTVEAGDEWSTAMQAYFLDQTDVEATKDRLQEIWWDGMLAICEQQAYDWCPS
ncbi:MAG: extracellular solute-binding protein [Anaerolineae bacterium]|nr:extracellular solute-binding protein [Anaerolineae bacterium]